jgi:hypothetical protein
MHEGSKVDFSLTSTLETFVLHTPCSQNQFCLHAPGQSIIEDSLLKCLWTSIVKVEL